MVYFVCDACNESLKKNQVEKHCHKCRSCKSVTCIDCSTTFYGDEYTSHNTCVSEAEKYQKSLHQVKPSKLSSQEVWMNSVKEATSDLGSAPISMQNYLKRLSGFDNVPKNKAKFANFMKNSLKISSTEVVDSVWKWIDAIASKAVETTARNEVEAIVPPITIAEEFPLETNALKKKKKKRRIEDVDKE